MLQQQQAVVDQAVVSGSAGQAPPPPQMQFPLVSLPSTSAQHQQPLSTAAAALAIAAAAPKQEQTPKESYRQLKRRFKFLVFENECYQEELRNLQRKLLKLSRDKNFLLDRLMLYEKLSDSSDESDASSVTKVDEAEKKPKRKSRPSQSRKKPTEKKDPGQGQQQPAPKDATTSCGSKQQKQIKDVAVQPQTTQGQEAQNAAASANAAKESSAEIDKLLPDVMAQYRVERSPAQFDYMAESL